MPETELTQFEADSLLRLEKYCLDPRPVIYPPTDYKTVVPLVSKDRKEEFCLDISCGRIDIARCKFQNRARQSVILARLEYGAHPHRNPDGREVLGTHLHLYRVDDADHWAYSLPEEVFGGCHSPTELLDGFMNYCHVVGKPPIAEGMFQ